jgi:hypothetical protein
MYPLVEFISSCIALSSMWALFMGEDYSFHLHSYKLFIAVWVSSAHDE